MTVALSVLVSVYKGEAYLTGFFKNLKAQSCFSQLEVVMVANEPSPVEMKLMSEYASRYEQQIRVLEVSPRESLGASWNRAWKEASAPYLAIWNIDDRRPSDSLERQLTAIQNTDWLLCYGDYIRVSNYGDETGTLHTTPRYEPSHFARAFAQGGAFWVFSREIAEQAGYFDEQLKVAADMDLSLRLAALGLPMGKTQGVIGYFTDAAQGLSTREGGSLSAVERTVVQLRYGVYDKVDPQLRSTAENYRINAVQSYGQWISVATLVPNYSEFLQARKRLWAAGNWRYAMRRFLSRLGLLSLLHKVQARFFRKEI